MLDYTLKTYFTVLNTFSPVNGLVVVGSGMGSCIETFSNISVSKALLLEANIKQIERMNKQYKLPEGWLVRNTLVFDDQDKKSFNIANNPQFSSVDSLAQVKSVWPNIETVATKEYESFSLKVVLENEENSGDYNYLFIDVLSAVEILRNALSIVSQFDVVVISVLDGESEDVINLMAQHSFEYIKSFDDRSFKVEFLLFIYNKQKVLIERITKLEERIKNLQEELSRTKGYFNVRRKQAIEREEEIKILKTNLNRKYQDFDKKIQHFLFKNNTKIFQHMESFINLQNYFIHDSKPISFHDWRISPDLGLFLIEKYEQNNYDLVIEFGSGTSTVLFSKIIEHQKEIDNNLKKIISFEHSEHYYNQTQNLLDLEGTCGYVDLVYAPLVEYQYDNENYLYYDCEEKIQQIALENQSLKVMVLVDGPPGDTCSNARFPVLPLLLKNLNNVEIHLVLDDFNRKEEKNIAYMWEKLLARENLKFTIEVIDGEKGIYINKVSTKHQKRRKRRKKPIET